MRAVDTDRAFINMVLTKGEADQRGSRRARCVCRGTFQDRAVARGGRDGRRTPSNGKLTRTEPALVPAREMNRVGRREIKSFPCMHQNPPKTSQLQDQHHHSFLTVTFQDILKASPNLCFGQVPFPTVEPYVLYIYTVYSHNCFSNTFKR